MRLALLAASMAVLSACTSTSSPTDVLAVRPSQEVVGAIPDPGTPVEAASAAQPMPPALARDGTVPLSLVEEQETEVAALMAPPPGALAVAPERPTVLPEKRRIKPAVAKPRGEWKVYKASFGEHHPVKFAGGGPHGHEVHGIDVSWYQGNIDWHTARKGGVNFAFIKATEGKDHLDSKFRQNWNAAGEAGVPRGAYHFYWFCSPAELQAKWFIRNVPKDPKALPPVLDVEWNGHSKNCRKQPSQAVVLKKMETFMSILERHYGKKPIIYTTPDFYEDNLKGRFKDHTFWLRSVKAHPSRLYPNRTNYGFWQYSGTGKARGIRGPVDLNVFNGDSDDWRRWLAAQGL